MNKLHILTLIAVLAAIPACSKNKKSTAKTTPTPTATTGGGDKAAKTAEPSSAISDTDADKASPANLAKVIYFEFDQAVLGEDARNTLNNNAAWLKEDGSRTLTIEGHTDEVGTPEYNLALGQRRAKASRDYLIRLGIDEKRIRVITYGEERPASSEDSENRRSVFVATKKKK